MIVFLEVRSGCDLMLFTIKCYFLLYCHKLSNRLKFDFLFALKWSPRGDSETRRVTRGSHAAKQSKYHHTLKSKYCHYIFMLLIDLNVYGINSSEINDLLQTRFTTLFNSSIISTFLIIDTAKILKQIPKLKLQRKLQYLRNLFLTAQSSS